MLRKIFLHSRKKPPFSQPVTETIKKQRKFNQTQNCKTAVSPSSFGNLLLSLAPFKGPIGVDVDFAFNRSTYAHFADEQRIDSQRKVASQISWHATAARVAERARLVIAC